MLVSDLAALLPEISLFLSSILILMAGLFSSNKASLRFSILFSLFSLFLAAVLVVYLYISDLNLYFTQGDIFILDNYVLLKLVILFFAFITLIFLLLKNPDGNFFRYEFLFLLLISVASMMLMVSSYNLLSLYVSVELQSLCLYLMVAMDKDRYLSTEAGLKYFVLGSLSSGIFLYGISLVYGFCGGLGFHDIILDNDVMNFGLGKSLGVIAVIVGLCFKCAIAPFHVWVPDVYQGSNTFVTAFISTTPKIACFAVLYRLLSTVFVTEHDYIFCVLQILVVLSLLLSSLGAIQQNVIKRLMAYGSVGHNGFVLAAIIACAKQGDGYWLPIAYIVLYGISTTAMFAFLLNNRDIKNIHDLSGLFKRQPLIAVSLTVVIFSMAGIPPLMGFFTKMLVLMKVVSVGWIALAAVMIVLTVITCVFYLKMLKMIYFVEPVKHGKVITSSSGYNVIIYCSALINIFAIFIVKHLF